jgi:ribonuclease P/MRP protein subunit POP5
MAIVKNNKPSHAKAANARAKAGAKPKVNALRPAMREKKRYLAFEIMSQQPLRLDADLVLIGKINELLGIFNSAKAGILRVRYDVRSQRGLFRIDRKFVDLVRTCFVMIKDVGGQKVLIRTLYVSGMLHKAGEALTVKENI